ncbi:hypothetical protein HK102_005921, partial [Quaeritorhiza haematococci]
MTVDEAVDFRDRVLDIVRTIPRGKVTSYGHVAKLAGKPRNARQVGHVLRSIPSHANNESQDPHQRDQQQRRRRRGFGAHFLDQDLDIENILNTLDERIAREEEERRRGGGVSSSSAGEDSGEDEDDSDEREGGGEGEEHERQGDRDEGEGGEQDPPWHRVLNHQGIISERVPRASVRRQARLLRREGVEVEERVLKGFVVDLG